MKQNPWRDSDDYWKDIKLGAANELTRGGMTLADLRSNFLAMPRRSEERVQSTYEYYANDSDSIGLEETMSEYFPYSKKKFAFVHAPKRKRANQSSEEDIFPPVVTKSVPLFVASSKLRILDSQDEVASIAGREHGQMPALDMTGDDLMPESSERATFYLKSVSELPASELLSLDECRFHTCDNGEDASDLKVGSIGLYLTNGSERRK